MPHVSPKQIDDKTLEQVYKILFSAITSKGVTQKQQQAAFGEVLTKTEKIMLGKRLAAISLLSQEMSSYKVGKVLQLSPTTTAKIQTKLEKGWFSNTNKLCAALRKGPLQRYLENLFKPLPRYGTSPTKIFRET